MSVRNIVLFACLLTSTSALALTGRTVIDYNEYEGEFTYSDSGSTTYNSTFDPEAYCDGGREGCRIFCNAGYQFSEQSNSDILMLVDCYLGCDESYGSCLEFYEN